MRRLAAASLVMLVLATAQASPRRLIAVRGSTMVVLTAEIGVSVKDCRPSNGRVAIVIDRDGRVRTGCWHMLDKHVVIEWGGGRESLYHQCEFETQRVRRCPRPGMEG